MELNVEQLKRLFIAFFSAEDVMGITLEMPVATIVLRSRGYNPRDFDMEVLVARASDVEYVSVQVETVLTQAIDEFYMIPVEAPVWDYRPDISMWQVSWAMAMPSVKGWGW